MLRYNTIKKYSCGAEEGAQLLSLLEEADRSGDERVGALVDTDAGTRVDTHVGAPITDLAAQLAFGRVSTEREPVAIQAAEHGAFSSQYMLNTCIQSRELLCNEKALLYLVLV